MGLRSQNDTFKMAVIEIYEITYLAITWVLAQLDSRFLCLYPLFWVKNIYVIQIFKKNDKTHFLCVIWEYGRLLEPIG